MKITENEIKLKRNQTAIMLYPAPFWSDFKIHWKQIGRNRFGEYYSREMFGGFNSYEEAINTIKKFDLYPPNFIIINRQATIHQLLITNY